jgi:deoxyribodipyrimidine photo-lyase
MNPRSDAAGSADQPDIVVVLFNRDLRLCDHPALSAACETAQAVVPLFVLDPALISAGGTSANRVAFLLESLADLRQGLNRRGGELWIRSGDPMVEAMKVAAEVGATSLYATEDVSVYAHRRQQRLARAFDRQRIRFELFPGVSVVAAGDLTPADGDHYKVFTPYWNRWREVARRPVLAAPRQVHTAEGSSGRLPSLASLTGGPTSHRRAKGGETVGRRQAWQWVTDHLGDYEDGHDDLAGNRTSRLSPYLHFGCVSANELAERSSQRAGSEPLVRQLCWRDFHHQVAAAFPELGRKDYRPRDRRWRDDPAVLEAWQAGQTGVPIVDAGMRQLLEEGWMHNRARLLVASYLTKDHDVHWTHGARHFMGWLTDADVANNYGNWQWVAGTGNDTRPNRRFNPTSQARRYDPNGDYVRRYVPELAGVEGPAVHASRHLDGHRYPVGGAGLPARKRGRPRRGAAHHEQPGSLTLFPYPEPS